MKTGKQIESDLCKAGINALWIKGRGMIVMDAYYGVDCAVQGKHKIIAKETAESLIGMNAEERGVIIHFAAARGYHEIR